MIITKYGTVTLRQDGGPLVDGWDIEVEPDDPKDATPEQLLLAYAIHWAQERFTAAVNEASMVAFRDIIKSKIAKKREENAKHVN